MGRIYQLVYRFSTCIIVILSLTNCSVDPAKDIIFDKEEQPKDLTIVAAFTPASADIPDLLEKRQELETKNIDDSVTSHIGTTPYLLKRHRQNTHNRRYQRKSKEDFYTEVTNLASSENVLPKLFQDSIHTAPGNLEQQLVKEKCKEELQPKSFNPEEEKSIKSWLSNIYLTNIPTDTAVSIASSLTRISKDYKIVFSEVNSVEDYNRMKHVINAIYNWKIKLRQNATIYNNTTHLKSYLILSFNIIYPYIEGLIKAEFFENLELEDKRALVTLFYALNFDIATMHLACLSNTGIPLSQTLIKRHLEEYKNAKNRLKTRIKGPYKEIVAKYVDMLSKDYELNLKSSPYLNQFFNVPIPQNLSNSEHRPSVRMSEARRKSKNMYTQKILKEMVSSYGISNGSTAKFLLQEMDLIVRLEQKNIPINWMELSKQYIKLEDAAISMLLDAGKISKHNCPLTTPMQWADLYAKIEEYLIKIDLYGLIRNGVTLYIHARCHDQARVRLKAMEYFYADKMESLTQELRKDFQMFQASVYALYGDYARLAQLYQVEINKKIANKKKSVARHQKAVAQLKSYQISQLKPAFSESPPTESAQVLPVLINKGNASPEELISEVAYQEEQQRKSKEMADRIKRHQQAEEQRMQENMPNHLVDSREKELSSDELKREPIDTAAVPSSTPIHFYLYPKAYNTLSKIFANDWKLSRSEVENLFDNLGQNIDVSTKSSHHIIKVSQGILLTDQNGEILGIMHGLANQAGGHLSLPEWEKVVPEYMRSQILNLIRLIGINQENYSKGNVSTHTNCIPIGNITNTDIQPTQAKPTTSKQKKKSKQGKKLKRAN